MAAWNLCWIGLRYIISQCLRISESGAVPVPIGVAA